MNTLGNLLWLVLGGLLTAMIYYLIGLIMCLTIIGIPFGVQLFKLGTFSLWPFGHELADSERSSGCLYVVMNLLWIVLGWWEIALLHLTFGCIFCLTIVGIPWGLQHFKMIGASLLPFGKDIVESR